MTHAHRDAALAQPADQVERFVGGDAAADDEQNAFAAGGAAVRCGIAGGVSFGAGAAGLVARPRARRMVRTSSSTERPFRAARSRSRFFSVSSSWRTVREATRKTFQNNSLQQFTALIAMQSLSQKQSSSSPA